MEPYRKRAWAEISLNSLEENIKSIRESLMPETEIMAVIKADAYGHGEGEICHKLEQIGIKYFAVSNLDEAVSVREHCNNGNILILGYTPSEYAKELERFNIIQGIVSMEHALELSQNANNKVRCHIKVDTGMGRVGLKHDNVSDCVDEIENIIKLRNLSVEGIYTHLAVADSDDESDITYTNAQIDYILSVYDELKNRGISLPHVHFLNSAGACYHNSGRSTLARIGIIMYGLHPNYEMDLPYELKPVLALKAIISQVKTIHEGDFVSYGRTFCAKSSIKVATVTVGYADGYSRLLSSRGEALVQGQRCKIIGRVCMDQLVLDVSCLEDIHAGEIVTLIGRDGEEIITADELASVYGTIGYEVVCGISKRVPRIYV
ncbi:MAG TPA: alanine racemase [Clostridiales bacterium]|nr:alanine racemase [Clostridiales bacterium]